ncbi:hypothetical protein DOTSEDRAFT_68670 [Dothistroma septosporum NZE10]|uniref:Uncharacterized protein n=1 Tax=Dothistroma septosporum (strain NZE10 / CBS 128990) TaxID=675120 RepID=N1Q519_DOTSN|nr:hypothetical protein DOTSEDRAFT_68670 [Dothistroma septosporum NZE10]
MTVPARRKDFQSSHRSVTEVNRQAFSRYDGAGSMPTTRILYIVDHADRYGQRTRFATIRCAVTSSQLKEH